MNEEELRKGYADGLSIRDLAKKFNTNTMRIRIAMAEFGIKPRNLSEAGKIRCKLKPQSNPARKGMRRNPKYGKDHWNWKGGYVRKDGYRIISVRGEQRLEHRYVWEQCHKKIIPEGWQVHHINFDKLDNRIENLQAIPNSEHQKLHNQFQKFDSKGKFEILD